MNNELKVMSNEQNVTSDEQKVSPLEKKKKSDIEKDFYKLLDKSHFGYNSRNNIEICL